MPLLFLLVLNDVELKATRENKESNKKPDAGFTFWKPKGVLYFFFRTEY
jgi:hypothetical protein